MYSANQLYLVIEECEGLTHADITTFQRRYRAREAAPCPVSRNKQAAR